MNKSNLNIGGMFDIKCFDKEGNLKWREYKHNIVTDEGIDHLLDVHFHNVTKVHPWYIMLKGDGAVAAADSLTSSTWAEVTAYDNDRKEFEENPASSKSISNVGNVASFSINDDATIYGAGLTSTASGTNGKLFSVVDFVSHRTVANEDTLTVQYTLTGADGA